MATYDVVLKQRQKEDCAVMLGQIRTFYFFSFTFSRMRQLFDCNVRIVPLVLGNAEKRRGFSAPLVSML